MINTYLTDFKIRLYLVGGEPLVYPQLNSIIQNLHEIKNMERLSICTNGTFYIKNLISDYFPIYYMLTYHADVIADKQLFSQHTNFIKNLEYITNQSNLKYHIKIMNNSNKINKLKDKFLNEIKELLINNKDVEYPVFLSTKYFKTETNNYNEYYNQYVYYHRAINITRDILFNRNNKIDYVFSYICNMKDVKQHKNIYSVKAWEQLANHVNDTILCKKTICPCNTGCTNVL